MMLDLLFGRDTVNALTAVLPTVVATALNFRDEPACVLMLPNMVGATSDVADPSVANASLSWTGTRSPQPLLMSAAALARPPVPPCRTALPPTVAPLPPFCPA